MSIYIYVYIYVNKYIYRFLLFRKPSCFWSFYSIEKTAPTFLALKKCAAYILYDFTSFG